MFQRLAGQVDALTEVVADFDYSALDAGLTRTEALDEMTGTPFLDARAADMRRTFARQIILTDQLATEAWKLIEDAGMRGARRGGAQMSEMHANFMINTGTASAADLEQLGEEVRKKVYEASGITLEWEIMRIGDP